MNWKANSILNNYNKNTPCKDIFHAYNKQFDKLYFSNDLNSCFQLFKRTQYLNRPFDYYMLETLNLNFGNYTDLEKEKLLDNYINSLESKINTHNQMIIYSLVEDLLNNEKFKKMVWNRLISAKLEDPSLVEELFNTLDVQENPELCFALFRKYPSYSLLFELGMNYDEFEDEEKDVIWKNYLYSLWVDFFEDNKRQEEVWNRLMNDNLNIEAIKKLLEYSGPVDFGHKLALINQHIANLEMHSSILMCLFGSLQDVYGDISFPDAQKILKQLKVNTSNQYYIYLEENLFKFNSKQEYLRSKKD